MSSNHAPARPAALITGAGSRIGIAAGIAARLADHGWDLALAYWRPAGVPSSPHRRTSNRARSQTGCALAARRSSCCRAT